MLFFCLSFRAVNWFELPDGGGLEIVICAKGRLVLHVRAATGLCLVVERLTILMSVSVTIT